MKIIIPVSVYQKLRAYVDNSKYEISGLGKLKKESDIITIEDVRIFRQIVSSGETILSHRSLSEFYDGIITEEGDLSSWKLWWHSHATFDAFFSQTDIDTIHDFDNEMVEDNWMLSIVTNHKGDLLARLDVFYPFHIALNNLEWDISFIDRNITLAARDEIAEKVIPFARPRKEYKQNNDTRAIFNEDGTLKKKEELSTMNFLFPPIQGEIVEEGQIA